jgi:hypothetical protein
MVLSVGRKGDECMYPVLCKKALANSITRNAETLLEMLTILIMM